MLEDSVEISHELLSERARVENMLTLPELGKRQIKNRPN